MSKSRTIGPQIQQLLLAGKSNRHITALLSVSSATVSYYARKLGISKVKRPTYNWLDVQNFINEGHTFADVKLKFGMCAATLTKAKNDGRLVYQTTSDMTADEFSKNINRRATPNDRKQLRKKLISEGLIYECSICNIDKWQGKKISLELDHIDGSSANNALNNLRLLCPNCHSQTPTWRGRNVGRYKTA